MLIICQTPLAILLPRRFNLVSTAVSRRAVSGRRLRAEQAAFLTAPEARNREAYLVFRVRILYRREN
jgi:hypothetical protein